MTRFVPIIKPITSPKPGGCATVYAIDAGPGILRDKTMDFKLMYTLIMINIISPFSRLKFIVESLETVSLYQPINI